MDKQKYEDFLKLDIEKYEYRYIFGADSLSEPIRRLKSNIKSLLDSSIIVVIQNDGKIPDNLVAYLDGAINTVNNFLEEIARLAGKWQEGGSAKTNLFPEKQSISSRINDYIQQVYSPLAQRDKDTPINNLLSILSLINSYKKDDPKIFEDYKNKLGAIDNKLNEFKDSSSEFNSKIEGADKIIIDKSSEFDGKIEEANKILEELRTEASKKVVYQYSNIFLEEASKHSKYDAEKKGFAKYGNAEKWLISGICVIIFTIIFIPLMSYFFPIVKDDKIDFSVLITKVSLLSILVFFISFSFKQYSINKHLYTLNKHRENVLNSYQLFLSTVGEESTDIRNVLMMEVAKAIYEHGKTGFVTDKDGDSSSPSIVEISKFLTKDK
jgi:hypothetical protein